VPAELYEHPGSKDALPHDKFIRKVSENESPVTQGYVKTKDGLYVAVALRKPKGGGPFPALIYFHAAPGGRGMEQLLGWSRSESYDLNVCGSTRRLHSSPPASSSALSAGW